MPANRGNKASRASPLLQGIASALGGRTVGLIVLTQPMQRQLGV
jgi:hypothetical protein